MAKRGKTTDASYGIGAVARLTGMSVHALRVWERRHAAVEPRRTEGGRREYTHEDVERLTLMKRLVDRGERIGRIASLSRKALEARLEEFGRRASERVEDTPGLRRVAAYGAFLGVALDEELSHAEIVSRATRLERFRSDIRRVRPEVLLLELPIVNDTTRSQVAALRRESGAERVVAVFGISRRADAERLAAECEVLLRAPVTAEEIDRALVVPVRQKRRRVAKSDTQEATTEALAALGLGDIPARRYTRNQLTRIAAMPSAVECECPNHLAELIDRLSTFEEYSADCESRNREDAALHAYLHAASAHARALIEIALSRVIEAEGLDPGAP